MLIQIQFVKPVVQNLQIANSVHIIKAVSNLSVYNVFQDFTQHSKAPVKPVQQIALAVLALYLILYALSVH